MAAFEDPKKAAELYKGLINDGYSVEDIGTEEQFIKGIENKKIAKQIYDGLITDGYTPDEIGEEDKFMSTFTKKQLTSKIVFDEPAAPEKPAEFESVDPLRQIGIKAYMRKMKEIDQKVDDLTGLAITPQGLTEDKAIPEIGKLKKKEIEAAAGPDGSQFTRLYEDFKDLPEGNEVDYAKYQKELQENPESYTRSVAALKWQRNLANAIAGKEGEDMGSKIYSRLLQMHRYGGSYIQRKEVTSDLILHVRKYVDDTDKQEEIIKNIALDRAESFGSQLAFGNEGEMAVNPLSDRLNKYQIGYIDFLESIDPNRANAFKRTLGVDQETVKASVSSGNPDMLIGYEKDAREAEAGGVMLAMNTVKERLQKFMLKAKEVGGVQNLNMAEASEVKTLMEKYTELEAEINSQPNRYPTTKVMDTGRMMQEAMGESKNSLGKRFLLNIGQGVDNTFSFVETMGYKMFGSDKDLAEHELRQIGKSETFSSLQSYVPSENGFFQQGQVFDFSAIQGKIDEIKDSNLSGEQKQQQIQKLMIDNYAQVATVENPNSGKINWTGTGMMEGMNTVISQMIPMVATGYIMPGASASKMSQFKNLFTSSFLTTYEQTKVENLKNKVKNPELRAFVTTVITSAAEGMNLDLPMFKRMFGEGKGLVSKIANEVTQAEWDAAVKSATGGFKAKLANFAKATAGNVIESGKEGFTEGLGSGADAIVGNVAFGEDNDPWKIATDDFMITVAGLGIPSLAGVPFRYRSTGMDVKYSVWEMGANAAKFREKIQQQLQAGEIDQAAADHWNTVIDRSEKAVNATPPLKANGKPFTDSQKANYAFNMFTKEEAATQGENAPEPLKKKLDEVTAEADAQNNDIVSGKDDERIVKEAEKVLKGEPEQISQPIELDPRLPEDMPAEGQQEFNSAPYKKRIDEVNNDDSIPAAEREKKKDEIMKEWAQAEEKAGSVGVGGDVVGRDKVKEHISTLSDENYLFTHVTTENNARSITENGMSVSLGAGISSTLTASGKEGATNQVERLMNGEVVHRDLNNNSVAIISVPKAELDKMSGKTSDEKFENWLVENNHINDKGQLAIPKEFNAGYLSGESFITNKSAEQSLKEQPPTGPKAKVKAMQLRPLPELQAELNDLKKKREDWVKQGKDKYDPDAFADLEDQIAKWEKSVSDSKAGKTTKEVIEYEPGAEPAPIKKRSASELSEASSETVMAELAHFFPDKADLLNEGIEVTKKMREIDEKGGGDMFTGEPGEKGYPFPYRVYSQEINSRKSTPEKKQEAWDNLAKDIENAKEYIKNAPSDEELAARKAEKTKIEQEKENSIREKQADAKKRVENIENIKTTEKDFISKFPAKTRSSIPVLLADGVSKDDIEIMHDVVQTFERHDSETKDAFGVVSKYFEKNGYGVDSVKKLIEKLKTANLDMFKASARDAIIEDLEGRYSGGTGKKPNNGSYTGTPIPEKIDETQVEQVPGIPTYFWMRVDEYSDPVLLKFHGYKKEGNGYSDGDFDSELWYGEDADGNVDEYEYFSIQREPTYKHIKKEFGKEAADQWLAGQNGKKDVSIKAEEVFSQPENPVNFITKMKKQPVLKQDQANEVVLDWINYARELGKTDANNKKVVISLFDYTGNWAKGYHDAGYTTIQFDIQHAETGKVKHKKPQDLDPDGADAPDAPGMFSEEDILAQLQAGNRRIQIGMDLWKGYPDNLLMLKRILQDNGYTVEGILAAPPCTSFASSGAQWWKDQHDGGPGNNVLDQVMARYGQEILRRFDSPLEFNKMLVDVTEEWFRVLNPTLFYTMENPRGRIKAEMGLPDANMVFNPNNFGDPYTKETMLWGKFNNQLPTANVSATGGSKVHKLSSTQKIERSTTPEGFAYAFFMANHSKPETGTNTTTKKKKPSAKKEQSFETPQQVAKKIYEEINQLEEPTDERGLALAYIAGGGKVGEASLKKEVVGKVERAKLNTGKKENKTAEAKARDYVTKDGPTISDIAHKIWDNLPENIQQSITDQDIRNELISVLNSHNTRLSAAIEFRDRYTVKEVRNDLTQEDADAMTDADIARRAKLVDGLPDNQQQELIKLLEKYENQYGIIDWDKLEADTGAFDPDILSLSPETQNSLDEIIKQHNPKTTGEPDNSPDKDGVSEKAQKEKELTAARSDLDAATRKLSTAQEKIAKNKASQTDMFGATQQPGMFAVDATEANSILNPLKEAVKIAQAQVETLSKELKVIEDAENPDIFNQAPTVDQTEEPAPATDKATKRKIRDEKARKEIDDALNDFFNTGSSLTSGGIDPVKLEKGVKVVSLYVKQGVTKFADIIEDAYEKFGDMVKDMYAELKSAYGAYYNNAPDEEADVMDANIRSIKFTDIIKLEENVSDRPGNQPGYSGDSKNAVPADGSSVSGNGRGSRSDGVQNQGRDSEENRNAKGSEGSGDVLTPVIGEQGDQQLPESDQGSQPETADAGAFDGRGNRVDGTTGVDGDDGKRSASIDKGTATVAKSFKERQRINAEKQKQAESIPAKAMDEDNIRETLPYLLPEQQDDVIKAEKRFFSEEHKKIANGKGMMFTNGTGTGKTFTGLGIVKRFVKMGKGDVLIITPSQPKVEDWSNDGKALGLNIMKLDGTNTGGRGVVVTTFANFRANEELMKRDFDLIVYDESHRLMEDKKGSASSTTAAHYMAANKDFDSAMHRLTSTHPVWKEHSDLMKRYRDLNQSVNNDQAAFPEETEREIKAIGKRIDQLEIEQAKLKPGLEDRARASAENTKVVFLSATPFKSHFNLRYANGFLFNWGGETITNDRGSRVDAESRFFLDNFGSAYEWKYHRLQVRSDSSPDAVAMQEIAFSEKLMKDGVMSGRAIESDRDYSREFPKVAGFNSESFNKAFNDIFNYETNEFSGLQEAARDVFFNYNYTTQLFESLKTSMGMDRIKKHIALGRQVVIFHRRKQANATPPFQTIYDQTLINAKAKINDPNLRAEDKAKAEEAINQAEAFADKYNDLFEYEQDLDYRSAIEQIEQAFPGRVGYINGDISVKNKNAAIRDFNTDGKNPDIIVVQEEAGKEGISLHDVTGNRQRILMSMSMPISTTTALQVEGRIYRIGQESDAIFEYPLLGLDLETAYFGQNINRRLSTTENLAMGNASRDLIRSYAEGVLFNSSTEDPHLEQGKGGKEYDKREASAQSEFQKAKLVYATNQKKTGRRDQREGVDYFATAEPLGQKMVEWAYLRPTEHGMEPSAGHGAIAMWFPNYVTATSIEPSFDLYSKLTARAGGGTRKILNQKFEDHNIINKYNGIVMNPPFGASGKMAMDHIEKAFKHLAEGGRIVALIPNGGAMQKRLDDFLYGQDEKGKAKNPNAFLRKEILLPSVAFQQAGTTVNTKIVVIDKIANPDAVNEMNQGTIDLRDVKTIGELFDSIEFIDMPDRVAKQVDQAVIQTAAASAEPSQSGTINPIEETKHTQTNATIYSAKASRYLGDDYRSIDAKAKQNGGYYSRFTKSWLFKTKESAEKFRLEVNGNEESQTDSQVNESEQSLGDKIRDMKINLGGGLQSNIAGLPIALYNAAVETVALAVDAGETLAAAIKKAVDKHKLKDEPDFDLNEFSNLSATAAKVYSMSPGKQKTLHGATKAEIIDSYKGKTYTDSQRAMARKKFQDARKKNENSKSMFSRLKNWFGNISQHIDNPNRFVTKLQKDIGSYYGADTGKIPLGRVLEQNSTGKSLLEVEGFLKDVMKGLNKKSVLAGGNQTLGDDFHDYVMAKRVMDRLAQEAADSEVEVDPSSRSTGNITMDDAQAILNEIEKAGLTSMFDEKANAMQVKANQMLERMVMAGIISAKTFVEIKAKNDFYAPFAVVQNIQRQDDGLKVKYTAATIIKKIKGITAKSTDFGLIELANMQDSFSNGQITAEEFFDGATNLLDTLLADDKISQEEYDMEIEKLGEAGFRVGNIFDKFANMLYDSHRIAEKNKNLLKIADLASIDKEQMFAYVVNEKEGYQIKVPEGWGSIAYRDNGKIRHLVVNENAAKALQGLSDAGKSLFRSFVNTINKGLRFGAITASVNFQAVNFAIDLVRNGTVSRYGIFTGKGGADRLANTLLFVPQYVETLLVALYENIGRPLLKTVGVNADHTRLYKTFMNSQGYSSGAYDNPFKQDKRELKIHGPSAIQNVKESAGRIFGLIEGLGRSLEESHKMVAMERGMDVEGLKRVGISRLKNMVMASKSPQDLAAALDSVAYEMQNMAGSPHFQATSAFMKTMSLVFQFFSARVKGQLTDLRRLANMFGLGGEGVKLSAGERGTLLAQFALVAIPIVLNSINNYSDDDDEKERKNNMSEFDRNKNILVKIGEFDNGDGVSRPDYLKISARDIPALINHAANGVVEYIKHEDPESLKLMAKKISGEISPLDLEFEKKKYPGDVRSEGVLVESGISNMTPFFKYPYELAANRNSRYHSAILPYSLMQEYKKGRIAPYEVVKKNAKGQVTTKPWAISVSKILHENGIEWPAALIDHAENTLIGNVVDNTSDVGSGTGMEQRFIRSKSKYPVVPQKTE